MSAKNGIKEFVFSQLGVTFGESMKKRESVRGRVFVTIVASGDTLVKVKNYSKYQ